MFTLDTVTKAPSYDMLVRNNFTDEQVVQFYSISHVERGFLFNQIKHGLNEPKATLKVVGTQKCTRSLYDKVNAMAMEYMTKDFIVQGHKFNMRKMDWSFEWGNYKNAFGKCRRRRKGNYIYAKRLILSKWLLDNSNMTFEGWVDTMLHEIAHAIDVEIRGKSSHDYRWANIAETLGCKAERCASEEIHSSNAKYTISCPNGHTQAGHKFSRTIEEGRQSCSKCAKEHGVGFDRRFILTQTQNY